MILLLLVSFVVTAVADAFAQAPEGFEDASGFHYGREPSHE